jgi:hypothetical protein
LGHLRLGRLYKSKKWTEVIDLLESERNAVPQISAATLNAAEKEMIKLGRDPSLNYCFWLLVRITWSAKNRNLLSQLQQLGLESEHISSTFTLLSSLSDLIRNKTSDYSDLDAFSEISSLAFKQTLTETVAEQSRSLFGTNIEDIQQACGSYSSPKQFGILARKFFSNLLSRSLTYFINKELSNHIGSDHALKDIRSAKEFNNSLISYSYQSAKIIEEFAGSWYSKHNWESGGSISEEESQKFVAYAFKKLRLELESEGASS